MAASKAPGIPRKVSWVSALAAVQRDRDALDAGVHNLLRDFLGDQGAVGGQGDAQAFVGGILRQLEDVRAIERFAAGEHQDRVGEGGNLIDDVQALRGGQVVGRGKLGGGGAAMHATQVTAFGDFPKNQARQRLAGAGARARVHEIS